MINIKSFILSLGGIATVAIPIATCVSAKVNEENIYQKGEYSYDEKGWEKAEKLINKYSGNEKIDVKYSKSNKVELNDIIQNINIENNKRSATLATCIALAHLVYTIGRDRGL